MKDLIGAIEVRYGEYPGELNKERARRWFFKYKNRLTTTDKINYHRGANIDLLIVTNNPDYKKFNPRKPFKGKNPRFIVMGMNKSLLRFDFNANYKIHDDNYRGF